jgi:DNA polymerase
MSTERDDRKRILDDFRAWVGQNESLGLDWFLLEDGPEPESAPAPAGPADDPFLAVCNEFVAKTLPLIKSQPRRAAAEEPVKDKTAALAVLKEEVLPCTACSLHESRHTTVFGAGNPDAEVVFIGEAPGRDEDLQGEPFVGKSGQLLTKIMGAIGYSREDVFICNILKCRPPNNRDPQSDEVASCEPHLKRQLAILDPKVICCLGRVAAQTLLGTDASLGRLRETVHFYEGIPVMATYHPAALLRNPGWKRDTWNDVRKMRALVDALNGGDS